MHELIINHAIGPRRGEEEEDFILHNTCTKKYKYSCDKYNVPEKP